MSVNEIQALAQKFADAFVESVSLAKFPARQWHVRIGEGFSAHASLEKINQPIERGHFIDRAAVVFGHQRESGLLQILRYRFPREKVQMSWNVFAIKLAGSDAVKIRNQENEQSIFFQHPRGFAEVRHRIVHVFQHRPRRDRVVGRFIDGNLVEPLWIDAKIRDALGNFRNFHAFHLPTTLFHEIEEITIAATHVQQLL